MKLDLLVLAIAPVIAIILWIYLKDKYDKEPICILIKFFIFGILVKYVCNLWGRNTYKSKYIFRKILYFLHVFYSCWIS